jgi:hypothetical protein
LFKGPEKTWNYHNEDLKKLKIDIRPSHSEVSPSERKKSHLYDRSELKKFKIDIKGENYEDPRSYGKFLFFYSAAYTNFFQDFK